jgi:hypothetical protein
MLFDVFHTNHKIVHDTLILRIVLLRDLEIQLMTGVTSRQGVLTPPPTADSL